ncbi:hypothetical protein J4E91_003850 [Alternaria rosae]|nr:hypothetical protein J4E91_003850 [Alternaria rosae]
MTGDLYETVETVLTLSKIHGVRNLNILRYRMTAAHIPFQNHLPVVLKSHRDQRMLGMGQFEDEVRSRKPNRPKSMSKSPGLVPTTIESRQGSSMRPMSGTSTEETPEPRGEFSSTSASSQFTTLEEEYAALYHQRHEIGMRMEEIKRTFTVEQYAALMARLDPQELPTLKPWSDTNDG